MGIVARNDYMIASHLIDYAPGDMFVRLDGYDTLSFGILAGCHGQTLGPDVAVENVGDEFSILRVGLMIVELLFKLTLGHGGLANDRL